MAGLFGAGAFAGTVNTVVGSGSLLTFPTLIAMGYSPLVANVTNTVGVVPGAISGAYGYRRELVGQRDRLRRLAPLSVAGGLVGAGLLLVLPGASFERVVPYLIVLACLLVIAQPRLSARMRRREGANQAHSSVGFDVGMFATAVYGGYFGAAQGVMFIALLSIYIDDHLQRLNAAKNVVAAIVNSVAAVIFMVFAPIAWLPAGLLAAGSVIGGQIGSRVGRRLPQTVLRVLIVVAGLAVAIKLLVSP
jgi:uncharacterized membrane protein YfcA